MQNKARLELADYEAVSERGLLVSLLSTSYVRFVPLLALLSLLSVFPENDKMTYTVSQSIICNFISLLDEKSY